MVTPEENLGKFLGIKPTFETDFQSIQRMIPAKETSYFTHNLHTYAAKFIPQIPSIFIKYYSKPKMTVLDPMCGSGTTLIESTLLKRFAIGIDIDPIAKLISKVAITPIRKDILEEQNEILLKKISEEFKNYKKKISTIDLPDELSYPNHRLWFRKSVFIKLLVLRNSINSIGNNEEYKNFVKLCLSAIVKPVSNADPRDIFPERDLKNPVREKKDVFKEFKGTLLKNTSKLLKYSRKVNFKKNGRIINSDAREIDLQDESIDLIVTSPPYAYAMDYARVFQLSTLLFILNNRELRELKKKYIGTDRVSMKESLGSFKGIELLKEDILEVQEKDKKSAIILYKYFFDMYKVTSELYRVLKANKTKSQVMGGYLVYVIGNSTIRGTDFKTSEFLAKLCEKQGFSIERILERPYYARRLARKRANHSNVIKSDVFIVIKKDN